MRLGLTRQNVSEGDTTMNTNLIANKRIVSGIRPTGHIHLGNYLWRRS